MNDRIQELAEQAGLEYDFNPMLWLKYEKFAYLVIQDCLLALEPDPMAPAIDYDVEEKFYRRSADRIKKHFNHE